MAVVEACATAHMCNSMNCSQYWVARWQQQMPSSWPPLALMKVFQLLCSARLPALMHIFNTQQKLSGARVTTTHTHTATATEKAMNYHRSSRVIQKVNTYLENWMNINWMTDYIIRWPFFVLFPAVTTILLLCHFLHNFHAMRLFTVTLPFNLAGALPLSLIRAYDICLIAPRANKRLECGDRVVCSPLSFSLFRSRYACVCVCALRSHTMSSN